MKMDKLTREQAIELVGLAAVEAVERMDCECTSRVTAGTDWEGYDEWEATLYLDGEFSYISAVYFQRSEDTCVNEDGEYPDLSSLDWTVDHFEIG